MAVPSFSEGLLLPPRRVFSHWLYRDPEHHVGKMWGAFATLYPHGHATARVGWSERNYYRKNDSYKIRMTQSFSMIMQLQPTSTATDIRDWPFETMVPARPGRVRV